MSETKTLSLQDPAFLSLDSLLSKLALIDRLAKGVFLTRALCQEIEALKCALEELDKSASEVVGDATISVA